MPPTEGPRQRLDDERLVRNGERRPTAPGRLQVRRHRRRVRAALARRPCGRQGRAGLDAAPLGFLLRPGGRRDALAGQGRVLGSARYPRALPPALRRGQRPSGHLQAAAGEGRQGTGSPTASGVFLLLFPRGT
eukprot:scaffold8097_cov258-Pinguiococcus_pyrenoidosus.AAC.1